jgi:hypothetical protein
MSYLLTMYNTSIQHLDNQSLVGMATTVYETAFMHTMYPYLIFLMVISFIVFIKTFNVAILGVSMGIGMELLVYFSKLPPELHALSIGIIVFCIGISLFQFFRDVGG